MSYCFHPTSILLNWTSGEKFASKMARDLRVKANTPAVCKFEVHVQFQWRFCLRTNTLRALAIPTSSSAPRHWDVLQAKRPHRGIHEEQGNVRWPQRYEWCDQGFVRRFTNGFSLQQFLVGNSMFWESHQFFYNGAPTKDLINPMRSQSWGQLLYTTISKVQQTIPSMWLSPIFNHYPCPLPPPQEQ